MTSPATPLVCLALILLGFGGAGCVPPGGGDGREENDADFRAGMNRKQAGSYVRAVESFERVLQRNPRSAMAHFELGLIYYQNVTNYVAAIYHFDRVQRLQPGFNRIDVVRQLIKVCKQELVRDAMYGFTAQMQREMERLERTTQENAALRQEVAQLQARLKAGDPRSDATREAMLSSVSDPLQAMRTENLPESLEEPAPRAGTTVSYRVKAGDTLYSIARRYGLTEAALRAANPGVVPTRMGTGQEIRIPAR
jgi:LysM repeat protein